MLLNYLLQCAAHPCHYIKFARKEGRLGNKATGQTVWSQAYLLGFVHYWVFLKSVSKSE